MHSQQNIYKKKKGHNYVYVSKTNVVPVQAAKAYWQAKA